MIKKIVSYIFIALIVFSAFSYSSIAKNELDSSALEKIDPSLKLRIENKQNNKDMRKDVQNILVFMNQGKELTLEDFNSKMGFFERALKKIRLSPRSEFIGSVKSISSLKIDLRDTSVINALANNPDVKYIMIEPVLYLSNADAVKIINSDDVNSIIVAGTNLTGEGYTICLIDTGVDYTHPTLAGRIILGYDYVNNDNDPMDDHGHGTHIAGDLLAVAPDAKVAAVKVCDSTNACGGFDILQGVQWCIDNRAAYNIRAISISIGDFLSHPGDSPCPTWLDSVLSDAVNNKMFIAASSGNQGYTDGISYPACSPYAASVGATDDLDNLGPSTNRWDNLDLLAPGSSIVSTCLGGGVCVKSGTSISTPFVTAAGLLLEQNYDLRGFSAYTPYMVEDVLKDSGKVVNSWPRIDVLNAIESLCIQDSDCGTDHYSANYCSLNKVYRDFVSFNCATPGTISCSNSTNSQLVQTCPDTCTAGACDPIECYSNNDCGTDKFVSGKYCLSGNVYRDYLSFSCANPGKSNSYCSNSTDAIVIEECIFGCDGGECVACYSNADCSSSDLWVGNPYCNNNDVYQVFRTNYICINAGTASATCDFDESIALKQSCSGTCSNGACEDIECASDSDCGEDRWIGDNYCNANNVVQIFRKYSCNNPGTTASYCSHSDDELVKDSCSVSCSEGRCENIACYSNSDCGEDSWTGDRYCQADDVWQNFREFVCSNPGTVVSSCSYSDNPNLRRDCEFGCLGGVCLEPSNYICSINTDCGADGFIGEPYCSSGNVWQSYRNWYCNNPASKEATCGYMDNAQLKETCIGDCVDGVCIINACNINSDCGADGFIGEPYCSGKEVKQIYRTRACTVPGTDSCSYSDSINLKESCAYECSNGICINSSGISNSSKKDLIISNFLLQYPANPKAGSPVTLVFNVQNKGTESVSSVEWVLDADNGNPLSGFIPTLNPGDGRIIVRMITYSATGTYYTKAKVDPNNKVVEFNEGNNEQEVILTVT